MGFQLDPEEIARALAEPIQFGTYLVRVATATRDTQRNYLIQLGLEILGGCYDGTSIRFSFEEPHPGQPRRSLRTCLRTLFALGIESTDGGEFEYRAKDLVDRQCYANVSCDFNGVPKILLDGLARLDQESG